MSYISKTLNSEQYWIYSKYYKFMYFDNINGGWFSEEVKS